MQEKNTVAQQVKLCQPVYYDKVKLDYYDKMNNPVVGLCQLFNSQMQDIN